jgi:hypothetical protein
MASNRASIPLPERNTLQEEVAVGFFYHPWHAHANGRSYMHIERISRVLFLSSTPSVHNSTERREYELNDTKWVTCFFYFKCTISYVVSDSILNLKYV